jgi:hypothetical protein
MLPTVGEREISCPEKYRAEKEKPEEISWDTK